MNDVHVHFVGDVKILIAGRDGEGHRCCAARADLRMPGTYCAGLGIDGIRFDLTTWTGAFAAADRASRSGHIEVVDRHELTSGKERGHNEADGRDEQELSQFA